MHRQHFVLIGIIVLAFFLRIFQVTKIPPSLSWDEVSIGYNAYSILKTGRDEHGRFLPLDTFVAYGDYKPPLAIYTTVPFVGLFGLNELAVRLPSILAGTLTVVVIYFLVLELFSDTSQILNSKHEILNNIKIRNSKFKITEFFSDLGFRISDLRAIPILSALLLAVSPWHIQLSRAGFEANIATFFIVLGIWAVLASRLKPKLFLFCWLPFVGAIYTFNSARYISPFLALGLVYFCKTQIQKNRKQFFVGVAIAALLMLPILPHLFSKEARLRFTEVNIFTDSSIVETSNQRIALDGSQWWSKVLHNRRIGYAKSYLIHFFDQFEPKFLFIRGDGNPKFSIGDVGELYLMDLPFLIFGIYFLFSKQPKTAWLLAFWLIASIIPAATARETPHALRIENGLPVFIIFVSAGLYGFFLKLKGKSTKNILIIFICILYLGNILYYLHNYYIHYPQEYSGEWQYGYREALAFTSLHKDDYSKIVITEAIGRPYMYTLFYEKFDPVKFWQTRDDFFDAAGFYHVNGFDKYRFVAEGVKNWEKKTLYILKPNEVPTGANILYTVNQLDGNPTLVIFDT